MKEGYKEITMLQQREIEARVLAPLIRAFCREFGEERALETARRAIRETARESGAQSPQRTAAGLRRSGKTASKSSTRAARLP